MRAGAYANTIVILFVVTACIGAILYPTYRLAVRIVLEDLRISTATGLFELKEHFVALGLGVLPAYWYYWKLPLPSTAPPSGFDDAPCLHRVVGLHRRAHPQQHPGLRVVKIARVFPVFSQSSR